MQQTLTFIILSKETEAAKDLRRALSSRPHTSLLATGDDPERIFSEVARLRPSAVIVTLGPYADQTLSLVSRVAHEFPQTAVICASGDSSPDVILRSLRSGARDFLRLPVRADEFQTVLARTAEFASTHTTAPEKKGRVFSVFSSKGGCGSSFVATNLAAAQKRPTALLDLDLQGGELELLLGVRPKFSLADVVENRTRLDRALLMSYLTPHTRDLSLLAAPRKADAAEDIEPKHVYEVLELLRSHFDCVVVDTPNSFDSVTLAALDHSDTIILLLSLEIPAIRGAQRTLEIFDRLGYARDKVKVVVNRWSRQVDLDVRRVEQFLGERLVGHIQSDYHSVVNSINLGRPLIEHEPSSKVAQDVRNLAAALSPGAHLIEEPDSHKRTLGSIFRRKASPEIIGLGAALDEASLDKA